MQKRGMWCMIRAKDAAPTKSLNQPLSDKRGTRTGQAEARKAAKRDLSVIEAELHAALKSATKNKIKIGGLLVKAKETVPHGEWLAWLENNFALSERSAQHYMVAWKFGPNTKTLRI